MEVRPLPVPPHTHTLPTRGVAAFPRSILYMAPFLSPEHCRYSRNGLWCLVVRAVHDDARSYKGLPAHAFVELRAGPSGVYTERFRLSDLPVGDRSPEACRAHADAMALGLAPDELLSDEDVANLTQDDPARVAGVFHWLLSSDSTPRQPGRTAQFLAQTRTLVRQGNGLTVPQTRAVLNAHSGWVHKLFPPFDGDSASEGAPADAVAARAAQLSVHDVPTGRYAAPDTDGPLFKLDNVTEGKWAGWVFVNDGARHGTEAKYGAARPGAAYVGSHALELAAVARDPRAAAARYGVLTGTCGRCGRELDDPESVRLGLGPVCREATW